MPRRNSKPSSTDVLNHDESVKLMLAYLCVATEGREASLVRKVEVLDRLGLSDEEIARVCGSAQQSVRNARQIAKKKRKDSTVA